MSVQAYLAAGLKAQRAGQLPEAAVHFKQAVTEAPGDARAWTCLGSVLQMGGRYEDARTCYRNALKADATYPDATYNLGTLNQGERQLDEALTAYRRTLELAPAHAGALAGMATIMDWRGQDAEALQQLQQQMGEAPADLELELIYARLLSRDGRHQVALERLQAVLASADLTGHQRSRVHFALGRICDRQARYDDAFAHFEQANVLKGARFDANAFGEFVDELIETFSPAAMADMADSGVSDDRPIFIVGLPRSGSTLLEQILGAHPQVLAGGESTAFPRVAAALANAAHGGSYPGCIAACEAHELEGAAHTYLGQLPDTTQHVTDKLPGNFMHVASISRVLPGARIVNCVRDPLETALSCYMQNFAGGSLPYTYNLTHLAHYVNDYRRLMAHWQQLCAHGVLTLHQVHYELLVQDPQGQIRQLLQQLELPWSEQCLAFHEVAPPALTASNAQVRKPIYRDALGRAEHYRAHLGTLIEQLDSPA